MKNALKLCETKDFLRFIEIQLLTEEDPEITDKDQTIKNRLVPYFS